ncbi:MAG TPA: type I methionyl aminopeptidase [Candidatus Kryptonia bacterium]|nr:type I methionyl aminopeptidase [Candidatus Kryptonia bacterium]
MIMLKSRDEIELMRRANAIVAEVLAELRARVRPGVTTGALDAIAEDITRKRKAQPAFKGYEVAGRVYPRSVCISINEEVVHGIPSDERVLRESDIVGLDFGVCYEGYYGDAAVTVPVGQVSAEDDRLMRATHESLLAGIQEVVVGKRIGDVSAAIQTRVEREGYSVVRDFVGHGIGRRLHEDPQVPNFGTRDRGVRLRAGMVLAIEPMVNVGGPEVFIKEDGWTAVTRDGRRSAHFEHSVAVTDEGPYVLSAA